MTAAPTAPPRTVTISPAQMAVLRELCRDGDDNQAIAERLHLSVWTVKSHLGAIQTTLGVASKTAIVAAVLNRRIRVEAYGGKVAAEINTRDVIHLGPHPGALLLATDCCHRLVQDLPSRHRVTRNPSNVTCGGGA